jgi:hypothetical protein
MVLSWFRLQRAARAKRMPPSREMGVDERVPYPLDFWHSTVLFKTINAKFSSFM